MINFVKIDKCKKNRQIFIVIRIILVTLSTEYANYML